MRVHATAPGGWLTVAIPGAVLLVDRSSAGAAGAEEFLAALHSTDPAPAVLDLLTAGGFSAMPSFALVEYRGQSAHYFVRGGVEVAFSGPGGARSASGAGITTWNEQLISGVDGFTVAADDAAGGGSALPLVDGAVWANRVEVGAGDASSSTSLSEKSVDTPGFARATRPTETKTAASAAEETILPSEVDEETIAGPLPALASAAAPAPVPAPATAPTAAPQLHEDSLPVPEGTTGYDHLFGITQLKSVEAAAVRPQPDEEEAEDQASAPAPASPAQAGDDGIGDHDGLTMMSTDIAELRKKAAAARDAQPTTQAAPAEPQFRLTLPDGRSEPLDRPVIVGRSPSANKVSGSELPRLVTVGGTDPDISRSHVRFTVEGGTVVITDLHSRNGTLISLPGRPPQKLREGEPTSALSGTVVDLGGGVRLTVTETSQAASS
ncbi:hypothetical protein GCM10022286_17100 [Gryllotalpicola daejeonensis]|uniref:FHA domain-containing protein n=1 Tax=Gryllotalpicola daejeonensis TaxID=993087 RepID=A0ABP7ZJU6_9MICO